MTPLAVYETRYPCPKRRFELYGDCTRAVGTRNLVDFDIALPLARLDSRYERLWSHSTGLYMGYWILIAAVLLLLGIATVFEVYNPQMALAKPLGLVASLGAVGLAIALYHRRKVEHYQFRTDAGVAVLGIPRDQRHPSDFDAFTRLLVAHIHKARGEALVVDDQGGR